MPPRFDRLREKLLEAGIGPRHVKRYLAELHDHYDDALRAEILRGASPTEAERAAAARIGGDDGLLQSVLARPELRAFSVRYPWAIYGAGSLMAFAAVMVVSGFMEVFFLKFLAPHLGPSHAAWIWTPVMGIAVFNTYLLPLVLGAGLIVLAVRRRMRSWWPPAGLALLSVMAGMSTFSLHKPSAGLHGELQIGLGFIYPYPVMGENIARCVFNLVVLLGAYAMAMTQIRRRERLSLAP